MKMRNNYSNPSIWGWPWCLCPHDRDQPTFHGAFLVKKQFIRATKTCVQPDNHGPNNQSHQNIQPDIGEQQCDHSNKSQNTKHNPVVQGSIEEDDRSVSIEVEEEPGDKYNEKDNHGDGLPQQAEVEDEEHGHDVVDSEMVEVPSDAGNGVLVGVWEREGG
ncbi:hypothetical protein F2P56_018806 [Juglans regia]|uniref:Uncharacterized protein n=1 Tax=Juglans regia TaxID=51240 RepID=A0A833T8N1_JUGRE|nr:hypothetical protein F2P56_036923 [Juglans regia]KAF5462830.1 hypothetical protein F2P56_018806 [Juglans regia]